MSLINPIASPIKVHKKQTERKKEPQLNLEEFLELYQKRWVSLITCRKYSISEDEDEGGDQGEYVNCLEPLAKVLQPTII